MRLCKLAGFLIAGSLALAGCTYNPDIADADLLNDSRVIDTGVVPTRQPVQAGCEFRQRIVVGQGKYGRRHGNSTKWRYRSKEREVRCAPQPRTYNPYRRR